MKSQQDYEIDIRLNKVKEGFLIKRSRILKQWKQRWMVLTKTHLYSFIQKQQYKKPTQSIPLKEVSTIKSYYKNQYNRPQVIRIQSADADFYLSTKNHQQKWAWMTAIQKMTNLIVCGQEQGGDSQNMIRETIRMTTAIRKTVNMKGDKLSNGMGNSSDVPKDLMKKLRLVIEHGCCSVIVTPTLPVIDQMVQQPQKVATIIPAKIQPQKTLPIVNVNHPESQSQIIIQKIVYMPGQIKQKIVYVPEVKEVIREVIKTVYVDKGDLNGERKKQLGDESSSDETLLEFLEQVMELKCEVTFFVDIMQNPKPLIEFIVFLIFSDPEQYTSLVLKFVTSERVQHAFSNAFLQVINQCIKFYINDRNRLAQAELLPAIHHRLILEQQRILLPQ